VLTHPLVETLSDSAVRKGVAERKAGRGRACLVSESQRTYTGKADPVHSRGPERGWRARGLSPSEVQATGAQPRR